MSERKYFYVSWVNVEPGSQMIGSFATECWRELFPIAVYHRMLREQFGETAAILSFQEIEKDQYDDFLLFCRQNGYGSFGEKSERLRVIKNERTPDNI